MPKILGLVNVVLFLRMTFIFGSDKEFPFFPFKKIEDYAWLLFYLYVPNSIASPDELAYFQVYGGLMFLS